jgi:predicted RNase H-related nuclease YkuK (DUF458 family)
MARKHRKEVEFDFDEIRDAISNSSESSAVYVGADSQRYKKRGVYYVAYVTVIILHIDGEHGGRLFKEVKVQRDFGQVRLRLMNEVYMASAAAVQILDVLGDRIFEIHLDINPDVKYKSSTVVKEATGYILGMFGFKPKIKPEGFAASTVSDRYTK